jgi:hypothetical protein
MPSNYSLWPQQARPRRSKPLTLAGGVFAIGVGCAVTAYLVIAAFSPDHAPRDAFFARQAR